MIVRTTIRTRYSPKGAHLPEMSSLEVGAEVEIDLAVKSDETITMRLAGARQMAKHIAESAVPTAMEVLDYVHRRVETGGIGPDGADLAANSAGPHPGSEGVVQEVGRDRPSGCTTVPPLDDLE